jgi:hypothetical protein
MEILRAALHDAVASQMLVTMLMMGAVASLVALVEYRGAKRFALAAMALLAVAHLFFGHRFARAPAVPHGEIGAGHEAAGCSDRAAGAEHDVARHGRGSPRQIETAR